MCFLLNILLIAIYRGDDSPDEDDYGVFINAVCHNALMMMPKVTTTVMTMVTTLMMKISDDDNGCDDGGDDVGVDYGEDDDDDDDGNDDGDDSMVCRILTLTSSV